MTGARSLIRTAFSDLAQSAIANGDLRRDVDPDDLIRALVGIFHTTYEPGWEQTARRLVDILIAGSRSSKVNAE